MLKRSLFAAAALTLVAGASQAQSFVNPGFEASSIVGGPYSQDLAGSNIGGWLVVGGGVTVMSQSFLFDFGPGPDFSFPGNAPTVPQWVDLTGLDSTSNLGRGVSQALQLQTGSVYNISFDIGRLAVFSNSASVQVFMNDTSLGVFTNDGSQDWTRVTTANFTAPVPGPSQNGFTAFTFLGASSTTLPFQTANIGLDNVQISLVSEVPEPSSYAMMIAGLGVLGFAARRKRKSA